MNLVTSRDHALRVAVWAVIGTEAVMFATLLVLRGGPDMQLHAPTLALAAAVAGLLFAGGGALALALQRVREGRTAGASRLVVAVGIFGLLALALELASPRLSGLRDPLSVAILGLHAAHVGAAIALAIWVLALIRCGLIARRHHDVLALVGTYWYFVAGVWVFVWPLLSTQRP